MVPDSLDISTLRELYARGETDPVAVAEAVVARCAAYPDPAVWISRFDEGTILNSARELIRQGGPSPDKPLWGIPFGVKDSIDCAGLDTTAACPEYAYSPKEDAAVVARLKAAGALLIGKTNLDQFATGLNGTRSPYGAPRSVFNPDYISGGSSSGSAVAVAAGLVSFALATDTAGSGRVPAAFNNIVGIKPSCGLISARGLVPACRSIDCVTVMALTVADGTLVRRVAQGFDPADAFSRKGDQHPTPSAWRIGVLAEEDRVFFGDDGAAALYGRAIGNLAGVGAEMVTIDYAPFREAGALLYDGPWVAERLAAFDGFIGEHEAAIDPAVRAIIMGAKNKSAAETFRGMYRLRELARRAEAVWETVDGLMLPTSPTTYTVAEMRADPIRLNSNLGIYTNFGNLLDCAVAAIPGGFRDDGIPFGLSFLGPAFHDDALAVLADRMQRAYPFGMGKDRDAPLPETGLDTRGASADNVEIFVVGAHLSGMPLNRELTAIGGKFVKACKTSGRYRLFVLPDTAPPKPGLIRDSNGVGIEGEVWALAPSAFGQFVAAIPSPLGIGKIEMEDGQRVSGFLCEAYAVQGAEDITHYVGWRAYRAAIG